MITVCQYEAPSVRREEILRYAGGQGSDSSIDSLLQTCLEEAMPSLRYQVCYRLLDVTATEETCDFGLFRVASKSLAKNLNGCKQVILLAATVGVGPDRFVSRYGKISPAKALMHQAIGAERIEALCDHFCKEYETKHHVHLRPRFSSGYGDLPLDAQKHIFAVLDPMRHIGLCLNDSLLMSPTKSVTAFVGIDA